MLIKSDSKGIADIAFDAAASSNINSHMAEDSNCF